MSDPAAHSSDRERNRRRVRRAALVIVCLLYVASIPWYRQADEPIRLWFGLPDWVAVAVLCYALAAVFNSIAWLATDVPDHPVSQLEPRSVQTNGRLDSRSATGTGAGPDDA